MLTSRNAIADNIRAEMARRSVTQLELARELGITQPAVSQKLSGRRAFSVAEIRRIAVIFDVPAGVLLGDEPARSAS